MIDYNQFNKISTNLIGTIFLIIGLIGFALAIYIYMQPVQKPDIERHMTETLSECAEIAKSNLDFFTELDVKSQQLIIKKYGLNDAADTLFISESIISRCNNVEVQEFCFGKKDNKYGCDKSEGLTIILKYVNPWQK